MFLTGCSQAAVAGGLIIRNYDWDYRCSTGRGHRPPGAGMLVPVGLLDGVNDAGLAV
jgi:hypothetical protein